MKRKVTLIILALVCALCCAFGLAACGDNNEPKHTHNYQWVDNGDGTHKQHCLADDCDAPDINIVSHDYGTTGICVCGRSQSGESHKHDMTFIPMKDADCTTDGNVAYWYCSGCEKYFLDNNGNSELKDIIIPAKEHDWDSGKITIPADCSQDGVRTFECGGCHDTKTESIPASHTWGDWKFFNDDLHTRTCIKCSKPDEPREHFWDHNSCEACHTTITDYSAGMKYIAITKAEEIIAYRITDIGTASDTDLLIPEKHNDLPVIEISDFSFRNCEKLTSVFIPDSVDIIGYASFSGCSALASMTLPFVGGTADIGGEVGVLGYIFGRDEFSGGEATKQCYYGAADMSGDYITYYIPASLKEIVVTNDNISRGAFFACKNLIEITLSDGIKRIGDRAFQNCASLTKLNIPNTVIFVGQNVLDGCDSLHYTTYNNGVYFGNTDNPHYILKSIVDTKVTSFIIHNNTICIIANLESLSNATNISIPNGITCVHAPGYISSLYKKGAAKDWYGGVYLGNSSNPYLVLFTNRSFNADTTVNTRTKVIASRAFSNGYGDNLNIPDNVQYIGDNIFGNGDSSIKNLTIGSGVIDMDETFRSGTYDIPLQSISVSAQNRNYTVKDGVLFNKDCTKLIRYPDEKTDEFYTIPSTVKMIAPHAFSKVKNLKQVNIPDSVTKIGHRGFCESSLESIDIPDSIKNISSEALSSCLLTSVKIGNGITVISNGMFMWCKKLTNISMPDSVTTIGEDAFAICKSLESVKLSDNLTRIDGFGGCKKLTSITIPNGVTHICDQAFYECTNLKSITIPNSVTSIGDDAFSGCETLDSITIPNSVTSMARMPFRACSLLTIYCEVENKPSDWSQLWCIFDDVGGKCPVVWDCKNNNVASDGYIYTLYNGIRYAIKDGVATVARQSTQISGDVMIPSSITYGNNEYNVTSIGNEAFYKCNNLTSITIPNCVTRIGNWAFSRCSGLTSITFNDAKAQWNTITKGFDWNSGTGNYTIHCTDGDIVKS